MEKQQLVANINATLSSMSAGTKKNQFRQVSQRIMEQMRLQSDITELNLSDIRMTSIHKEIKILLRDFKNIVILVINQNGLTSLDGLPAEWKLVSLDASRNKLGDCSLKKIGEYKELSQLIIRDNMITKTEALKHISSLQKLSQIELQGNPVAGNEDYKKYLIEQMPNLKVIDYENLEDDQSDAEDDQQQDAFQQIDSSQEQFDQS